MARRILEGHQIDTDYFPMIYEADKDDPWDDPETWKKANPALGHILRLEDIEKECEAAKHSFIERMNFCRYRINRPINSLDQWISDEEWNACSSPPEITPGMKKFAAIDLSKSRDLTCYLEVYRDYDLEEAVYHVMPFFFLPEETLKQQTSRGNTHYQDWKERGFLIETCGNVVDYDVIEKFILDRSFEHRPEEIAYDPLYALGVVQHLQEEGIEVVGFRQTAYNYAAPTLETEKAVLSRRIRHGGNPVLAWCMQNTRIVTDKDDNKKPVKGDDDEKKVDGAQCLVMAIARAELYKPFWTPYDD